MSPARRQILLTALMLVLLAGAAWWSVGWMNTQAARARRAAADLADCRALAAAISATNNQARVATSETTGFERLGEHVKAAAQRAGLDQLALDGIYPQRAERLGDTPYVRKPTRLSLRNVDLTALATFLYHLTDQSGLTLRDLHLRSPRSGADRTWDVDATVTYLIYSPPPPRRGN